MSIIESGIGAKFSASRLNIVFRHLKPYRRQVLFLSALSLMSAFFSAITPYIAGTIVDSLIKPQTMFLGYVLPVAPAFFFFFVWLAMQVVVTFVDSVLNYKNRLLDELVYADYMVAATTHVLNLPMSFHKEKKVGEIQNRLSSAGQNLSTIVSNILVALMPQFLSILIALAVTIIIKPILALMLCAVVAMYLAVLFKIGPRYSKLARKMWRAYNRAHGDAYDAAQNAQSVKQAGAEHYEQKRLYTSFHIRALTYMRQMLFLWQIMNTSQRVLTVVAQAGVYLSAIYFITQGTMTIGQLVMFNAYVALFLGPFVILMNNWQVIQNGLASIERAEKVLLEKEEDYTDTDSVILPDIAGAVEFRDVTFAYGKKHKTILQNISFSAEPGQVIALVGESGVGKSTMMDLLGRYFDATEGKILIDGHNIQMLNLQFLRSKFAVVPQEIMLFNDTIKNNIKYGYFGASDKKIIEAAQMAHADRFIEEFPKKYRQIVGERGVKLSTGQKQRIAIARAVLRAPRILILDEPTSALDARSEKLVEDALRELMRGRTTFIIAHRLSTVRHADKILVVEKGRIVEQGIHEELMKIPGGIYQKLYNLQIGLKA